jgi:hypothetical protein
LAHPPRSVPIVCTSRARLPAATTPWHARVYSCASWATTQPRGQSAAQRSQHQRVQGLACSDGAGGGCRGRGRGSPRIAKRLDLAAIATRCGTATATKQTRASPSGTDAALRPATHALRVAARGGQVIASFGERAAIRPIHSSAQVDLAAHLPAVTANPHGARRLRANMPTDTDWMRASRP